MKASELSAILAKWPVLRCSPIEIEDEQGRRFRLVCWSAAVPGEPDKDGRQKPSDVPTLRLVIRELTSSPAPGETKPEG